MATATARAEPRPRRAPQPQPRTRAQPRPAPRKRAAARPRLAGSVVWILVVAALLAGIVALNVGVLRLNMEGERLDEEYNQLDTRHQELETELSRKAAAGRIEGIALAPAGARQGRGAQLPPPAAAQEGIAPRAPGQQAHPSADRGLRAPLPGRVRARGVASGGQGARARPHRDEPAPRGARGARAPRDDLRPARAGSSRSASARRPCMRIRARWSMHGLPRSSPAVRSRSSRPTSMSCCRIARAGSSISRARLIRRRRRTSSGRRSPGSASTRRSAASTRRRRSPPRSWATRAPRTRASRASS